MQCCELARASLAQGVGHSCPSDLKQTKFKSYGLSILRVDEHDETTQIFKDLFDNWIDLGNKSDQETVNIIQNSNIDILVVLAGLWSSNRVNIFNTRICPLQISWLGFNNSTGLKLSLIHI